MVAVVGEITKSEAGIIIRTKAATRTDPRRMAALKLAAVLPGMLRSNPKARRGHRTYQTLLLTQIGFRSRPWQLRSRQQGLWTCAHLSLQYKSPWICARLHKSPWIFARLHKNLWTFVRR